MAETVVKTATADVVNFINEVCSIPTAAGDCYG
jgi:hypothetical protein